MQFKFISGFAAMSAIIGPAFANPFPSASTDMDNHTSSNTTWKGVIEGHAYELHGDASQVIAQLEATYPGIIKRLTDRAVTQSTEIQPRNKAQVICVPVPGQPWERGWYDDVNAGIADLKILGIGGGTVTGPGLNCVRITCHSQTGIFLCNDRPDAIFPWAGYIATYAQDLVNQCTNKVGKHPHPWSTGGQNFDTDGYNVIARWLPNPGCV